MFWVQNWVFKKNLDGSAPFFGQETHEHVKTTKKRCLEAKKEISFVKMHLVRVGAHMDPYGPIWAHMGPYGPLWAHMDRSGHDQIRTFGTIWYVSGPKLTF